MIKGKYPKSLYEAVAIQEFLGLLGYSKTTEIFIAFKRGDVSVLLKAEGIEGHLRIGVAELPRVEMIKKWEELVSENARGTITKDDKNEIFLSSKVFAHQDETMAALSKAGFRRFLKQMRANLN